MTLEDLYNQVQAIREVLVEKRLTQLSRDRLHHFLYEDEYYAEYALNWLNTYVGRNFVTAMYLHYFKAVYTFHVARTQGLDAAMLWKLSYGS